MTADAANGAVKPFRHKIRPALVSRARLVRFFVALTLKEHVKPDLHLRPLVAELFLTENCNLRCRSCACWRSTTRSELTTSEWKSVIAQCADLGLVKLNFTGGEPLVRRDAATLISYARDLGIARLHLNTNALLLDAERRTELIEAGVRSFNVSLDGPNATVHDGIRGVPGAFERSVGNLRELVAERSRHRLNIRLNFTVLSANVSALPDMALLAQELDVQLYLNLGTDTTFLFRDEEVSQLVRVDRPALTEALRRLETLARQDHKGLPRFSDLRYVAQHFDDRLQSHLPCAESQLKLMIHSTGGVGGCWGHDPVHNVRDMSIKDIVATRHYRDQHARLFRKDCIGCGSNYSLNLRWRPATYFEDARWRLRRRSLVDS
jgi:MoaA/NifB/PqqE/SkfB family radical SAM enzyme